MKQVDIAYCAGLVDGEGYVGIKKSKAYACQGRKTPGYHARIQVRMVDEPAVKLLADLFSGTYYKEQPNANNGRPLFCWQVSDLSAERVLRILRPFLRVKAVQADIIFAFRELQATRSKHATKITGYRNFPNAKGTQRRVANKCLSDEYVAWCDAFWMDCRKLNGLARFQ